MVRRLLPLFIFGIVLISFFGLPLFVQADVLGQEVRFFVNADFDAFKRTSLTATLKHISNKAYFYVDDSYWNSLSLPNQNTLINNIISLAQEFDNNIYPKEVELWGSEPNPGIDGDSRVTILLEELVKSNGGYFETTHGYPRTQLPNSNAREMIFVNAKILSSDLWIVREFLAHEFQHLISFNQKELAQDVTEDAWLNETRAEYSVTQVGYNDTYADSNLSRRAQTFFENPYDSLTEWPNSVTDYGMAALFGEYLVDQFSANILSETIRQPLAGINSLNAYLGLGGYGERFEDIFINWMTASYLNIFKQDSRLGYKRLELQDQKVQPQQRIFLSPSIQQSSITQNIKDWQPAWIEADVSSIVDDPSQSFKLELSGNSSEKFIAGYIVFNNGVPAPLVRIKFYSGKGVAYISNSEGLDSVALFITKGTKVSGFSTTESYSPLYINISVVPNEEVIANIIKDGDLIRKKGEKETYVIWGKYKRYLTSGVIALYGHLISANVIELEPEVFNSYTTSNYVKYVDDEKVYAIWPDGTKHWLKITPRQWDDSRRDWGAIYVINDLELNYYKTGADITR